MIPVFTLIMYVNILSLGYFWYKREYDKGLHWVAIWSLVGCAWILFLG